MTDPPRLLKDQGTSALERRVLDAAAAIAAPAGEKARGWASLSLQIGAAAPTLAQGAATAVIVKAVAAGVVLGATAAGTVAFLVAPSQRPEAPAQAPLLVSSSDRGQRGRDPLPSLPPATPLAPVAPVQASSPSAVPNSDTKPRAVPAPERDPASRAAFPDAPLERSSGTMKRADESEGDRARLESQRVAEARGLIRAGRAQEAIVALEQLTRDFPEGILIQERVALTVEALAQTGQRARAEALAREFMRLYPSSPHTASVRRSLE